MRRETVVISGSGWEPGETVTLLLEETPTSHEVLMLFAVADETGAIVNGEYFPEEHDKGVRYLLTATGGRSSAQATFTDGAPTRITSSSMSPSSGGCLSSVTASARLEYKTGTGNSPFAPLPGKSVTLTLGSSSGSAVTDASGVASVLLIVPQSATSLVASFAGDAAYNPVSTSVGFSVAGACDATGPAISAILGGTMGANGWYTSDVTVTWAVTDGESAVTSLSGCEPSQILSDTGGTTLTCVATSAGGTSSASVTIKRDASPPLAVLAVTSGTPGSNGWFVSDVTLSTSGDDALSGPVVCSPDQSQTEETDGATFHGSDQRRAGHDS